MEFTFFSENKSKPGEGAVFGIPINQCVDPSRKRSTSDIPSEEVLSPTSKSSRSDSRTSFGSISDTMMKDKSMERVSGKKFFGIKQFTTCYNTMNDAFFSFTNVISFYEIL